MIAQYLCSLCKTEGSCLCRLMNDECICTQLLGIRSQVLSQQSGGDKDHNRRTGSVAHEGPRVFQNEAQLFVVGRPAETPDRVLRFSGKKATYSPGSENQRPSISINLFALIDLMGPASIVNLVLCSFVGRHRQSLRASCYIIPKY